MTYAWIEVSPGRSVFRKINDGPAPQRSHLPTPRIIRDFDAPVQSMADGKWYSSKRGLAASHKASGNPHGQEFIELGNEEMPWVEHKTDEKQLRDDIRAAVEDVKNGNVPPVLMLDD
jgi:hypothetical protein